MGRVSDIAVRQPSAAPELAHRHALDQHSGSSPSDPANPQPAPTSLAVPSPGHHQTCELGGRRRSPCPRRSQSCPGFRPTGGPVDPSRLCRVSPMRSASPAQHLPDRPDSRVRQKRSKKILHILPSRFEARGHRKAGHDFALVCESVTASLTARGGQPLPPTFNVQRDIPGA